MFRFRNLFFMVFLFSAEVSFGGDGQRVLIIGDSLTEGYGIAKSAAYPALVEKKLRKKHAGVEVVNAGSSGSTSASALSRLRWHMKKKPDLLVLALGANDGLRGIPVESTKKNLEKAIKLAKEKGVKVFLAGMKLPMNYGKDYRGKFEKVFSELAKEHKVKLIPFLLEGVGGVKELNLADGIHPNEKGHQKIAKTVADAIESEL